MGNEAQFHFGARGSGSDGLEFVGGAKRQSLFAQYTQQFNAAPQQQQQGPAPTQQPQAQNQPLPQEHLAALFPNAYGQDLEPKQVQFVPQTSLQKSLVQTVTDTQHEDTYQDLSSVMTDDDEVLQDIPSLKLKRVGNKNDPNYVRPSRLRMFGAYSAVFVSIAVLGISVLFLINSKPVVSNSLRAKAGFPVYDVTANSKFRVDRKSVEINSAGSLVYVLYRNGTNEKFVVSQQAIPEVIKDDAQYQQFLSDTDMFASMQSAIGKVYFTRPAGIGTDISVVSRGSDSLMFIRGSGTTDEQVWSELLSYLKK